MIFQNIDFHNVADMTPAEGGWLMWRLPANVRALTDEAVFRVREQLGVDPLRIEGEGSSSWTLIDFGSVVVHVFTREGREFYKLDRLWADTGAEKVKI